MTKPPFGDKAFLWRQSLPLWGQSLPLWGRWPAGPDEGPHQSPSVTASPEGKPKTPLPYFSAGAFFQRLSFSETQLFRGSAFQRLSFPSADFFRCCFFGHSSVCLLGLQVLSQNSTSVMRQPPGSRSSTNSPRVGTMRVKWSVFIWASSAAWSFQHSRK